METLRKQYGMLGFNGLQPAAFNGAAAVHKSMDEVSRLRLYQAIQMYVKIAHEGKKPVLWKFTHNSGNEKVHYTYHDETPQNDYRFAYRDTCIGIEALYTAIPDSWKDAVTDACTVIHLDWDDTDPRKTLGKLIQYEVEIALDPLVSDAARALIEHGRKLAPVETLAPVMAVLESSNASGFDTVSDAIQYPEAGTRWIHTKSGRVYGVLMITNTTPRKPTEKFPATVVYQDESGAVWSRLASDWHRSFTPKKEA